MTTAATPPTITDSRFNKLKAKLRELFELDKSDLDFGIYRIMAAKNKEVTEFLDRQLKDVVKQTLAEHGAGETASIDAEIAKARKAATDAGFDPDESPKVKELEAKLAAAGGKTGEQLEADIYNHLLTFFSRYYDEGDFISQRRYKGDTYAVPYSGEEVTLHWANKDQYYIKSGEWHKDYRFKLADGRRVRFALAEATQETGNNKEPDESKRRYILVDDQPVFAEGDTLTLRFHFRTPTDTESEQAKDKAVSIFGGKYEQSTKGDERTQFCADAERRALDQVPAEWLAGVTAASPTDDKPKRTLLGKHLDAFTARNTFDYFIHKDLGGFLRRELDFYIKNEVVRLDDLDHSPANHLQQIQGRVKAIRKVAAKVIDLIESLENFQKKLWLKKKFVLNTSWLVTIDRVPDSLRGFVADNKEQWAEWEMLGFKPGDGDNAGGLFAGAKWGTRAYLDVCDKLVVDTRFFGRSFTTELLASDDVLGTHANLDDATTGVLINSDNGQAVRLISPQQNGRINCTYVDPPYNTSENAFYYKNIYRHSSWIALLGNAMESVPDLLSDSGVFIGAIDDTEYSNFKYLIGQALGNDNYAGTVAVQVNPAGQNIRPNVPARSHDYFHIFARDIERTNMQLRQLTDDEKAAYSESDVDGPFYWDNLRRRGGNSRPTDRPKQWFPLYVAGDKVRVPAMKWVEKDRCYEVSDKPGKGEEEFWPIDPKGIERIWRVNPDGARREIKAGTISVISKASRREIVKKSRMPEGKKPKTLWADGRYSATTYGTKHLLKMFKGGAQFSYPKSIHLVTDAISYWSPDGTTVLDYFAGSGTTGEAVMMLNRADHGSRRFILVEMGEYFSTVLKPRITRVIYCKDWAAGKAVSHTSGVSSLVKCFSLESYEDALTNLPTPTGHIFDGRSDEERDALIRYSLDLELGPQMLDLDIFSDPWGHSIDAQIAGDDEIKPHPVDLVETFNYLLGLKVSAYGPIERYSAEFEQAEHDDGLGRLKIKGRLKRDPDGPFVFHRVEGVLNDANDTRVLVVWRKLTDNPDQDAAVLDAWMSRHRESTTERTEHRDYHEIYINGPVTLPQPTAEIRTVYPIEEAFKRKMFEDTEGAS